MRKRAHWPVMQKRRLINWRLWFQNCMNGSSICCYSCMTLFAYYTQSLVISVKKISIKWWCGCDGDWSVFWDFWQGMLYKRYIKKCSENRWTNCVPLEERYCTGTEKLWNTKKKKEFVYLDRKLLRTKMRWVGIETHKSLPQICVTIHPYLRLKRPNTGPIYPALTPAPL